MINVDNMFKLEPGTFMSDELQKSWQPSCFSFLGVFMESWICLSYHVHVALIMLHAWFHQGISIKTLA